jgi:hypothetical protein
MSIFSPKKFEEFLGKANFDFELLSLDIGTKGEWNDSAIYFL